MRKTLLFLFAFSCLTVSAQDVKKAIRDHYTSAKEYVSAVEKLESEGESYPVPMYFKVKCLQNYPGTGCHEENISMYYNEVENDDIIPPIYLDFAVMKYNFAACEYYEEYLYDRQGRIQFFYYAGPDVDGIDWEYRFYFNNGKLFDVLVKMREMDSDEYKTAYTGKTAPAKYNGIYQSKLNTSDHILKMFKAIDAVRHE